MNSKDLLRFLCFLLFAGTTIIFARGSYSVDSWEYYTQAAAGVFNDWHSPFMPFVWRVLQQITNTYASIYYLQMALYWLMFYLLLKEIANRYLFIFTVILGIFFIFIPQYVMIDVHVALPLGLGFLLLLDAAKNGGTKHYQWRKWVALFSCIYALWMRPNILFAIMPAVYLFVDMFLLKKAGVFKKILLSLGIPVVAAGGYFLFSYSLLDAQRSYPEYKLMLLDITGISKTLHTDLMPGCVSHHADYNRDSVMRLYHPASFDDVYWPESGRAFVPRPAKALAACVSKSWKNAIRHHPWIYIKNRMNGFLYYLRIRKRFAPEAYWNVAYWVHEPNPVGLSLRHDPATDIFCNLWSRLCSTPFYDPWLWLLLNVVLFSVFLFYFSKRRLYSYKILAFVQLSAIIFTLSQIPVYQHDRDFRYHYWNVIAAIIGVVYWLCSIKRRETAA